MPENIVLMYSEILLESKFKFQENAKAKVYALEDSLGVYRLWKCFLDHLKLNLQLQHLYELDLMVIVKTSSHSFRYGKIHF